MSVAIDHRERELIRVLSQSGIPHCVETLDVGDIVCKYAEHHMWIAERKRVDDLGKSITSGRWQDQLNRLYATGCCIFFLIEGDIRSTSVNYESLLGACINAELRQKSHVIRTLTIDETACAVKHLIKKGRHTPGIPIAVLTAPVSKRKRNADREECWIRQLMCVPSISERIARKLLDEYGTLQAIQTALVDIKTFKKVQLDDKTSLGKARLKTLSFYLCSTGDKAEGNTT